MSFYGLEIAKTGMYISQKNINIIGHNIANANTPGYTRQRLISEAIDPATINARFGVNVNGAVGGGARTQSLEQVRNSFIDSELRREYSSQSELSTRLDALDYIQRMFDETKSAPLTTALSKFFSAINDFSKEGNSVSMRTNLQQSGIAMTETFQSFYRQLAAMQKTQDESIKNTANTINDILVNISTYNRGIAGFELSGEKANDLRDKRNVELDKLSQLVDMSYSYDSNGLLSVSIGGVNVLEHTTVKKIEVKSDQTGASTGQIGFTGLYYQAEYEADGTAKPLVPLNYSGGELAGYRQMRDGDSADSMGIPYFIEQLNTLVRSLAKEMNAVHRAGHTQAVVGEPSQTNINLFEVPDGDYSKINIGNFSLSKEVLASVSNFAASDVPTTVPVDGKNELGNNNTALKLLALCTAEGLDTVGSFQGFLKGFTVGIGIETAHVMTMLESKDAEVGNLEERKESISGVSIEEEIVTLLKNRQMFAATSRVINAIDEAIDVIVNRTGLVGRG